MPELPEVEVVRRGLQQHVAGRTIAEVELIGLRVARRHLAGPVDLADRLRGTVVTGAHRRGKYLWLALADPDDPTGSRPGAAPGDETLAGREALTGHEGLTGHEEVTSHEALLLHLGMSGQLLISEPAATDQRHLHARIRFVDGGAELRFVDQRTFGGLAWSPLEGQLPRVIAHIARDPFDPAFDLMAATAAVKARSSAIKRVLLDQRVVSGIGNIYADEALWRAGVHGERIARQLTKPTISGILTHAREVMDEALAQGGTSFDRLYVNINGASGYFERSLQVYGRAGRPCQRCGAPIRRESFMNRGSFSCPRCQPRPRAMGDRPG